MEEFGYSRHASHQAISKQYQTSMSVIFSWITYGGSRKHQTQRPYSERIKNPNLKKDRSFKKCFDYDPTKFIAPLYQSPDESLSLDDLALRLKDSYDYLPHTWRLEKIATEGNPRTGEKILVPVPLSQPPLYQIVVELFDRYKSSSN